MLLLRYCSFFIFLSIDSGEILLAQSDAAEAYFNEGMESFNDHYLVKASVAFTNAIAVDQSYAKAYYYRGECFNRMDRKKQAISDYESSLLYDSSLLMSKIRLIHLYKDHKLFDKGLVISSQLIDLHPDNIGAGLYERGFFHQQLGNYDEAINDYSEFLNLEDEVLDDYKEEVRKQLMELKSRK